MLPAHAARQAYLYLDKTGFAPSQHHIAGAAEVRSLYYILAQSFTQHLISGLGMRDFIRVYSARDPEQALRQESWRGLDHWKQEWQRSIGGE